MLRQQLLRYNRSMRIAIPVLLCLFAGCSGEEPVGWHELDLGILEVDGDLGGRVLTADGARADLFNRLSGRLQEAVAADGPVHAIGVCRDEAPGFAAAVGERFGLTIGRTGVRLRNPVNAGPEWAADAIAAQATRKRAWLHSDGRLGVLTPIQTALTCLVCHGTAETLGPGVADALAEHYPADAATGFAEGDLRGWFWVEIPAAD